MKVAVVGSRTFTNRELLFAKLDELQRLHGPFSLIVSGGAAGADSLAEDYALAHEIEVLVLEPEWKRYGRGAGRVRNEQIVKAADMVVAFWNGESRGTANTIEIARRWAKAVVVVPA
jgi:predicted Rossmann fold nucleotide-binding protein DprA/Smf involved in DNA uptake